MFPAREPILPHQPAQSSSEFGSKIPLKSTVFDAENKLWFKHEFYYFQIGWCISYLELSYMTVKGFFFFLWGYDPVLTLISSFFSI